MQNLSISLNGLKCLVQYLRLGLFKSAQYIQVQSQFQKLVKTVITKKPDDKYLYLDQGYIVQGHDYHIWQAHCPTMSASREDN